MDETCYPDPLIPPSNTLVESLPSLPGVKLTPGASVNQETGPLHRASNMHQIFRPYDLPMWRANRRRKAPAQHRSEAKGDPALLNEHAGESDTSSEPTLSRNRFRRAKDDGSVHPFWWLHSSRT